MIHFFVQEVSFPLDFQLEYNPAKDVSDDNSGVVKTSHRVRQKSLHKKLSGVPMVTKLG